MHDAIPSPRWGQSVLDRLHRLHDARPHPSEPGSLSEQIEALNLYWADPTRRIDPDAAWAAARKLAMEHARRVAR